MIDILSLSAEEIEAIVNAIPRGAVGQYLSKNPKEFAQLMPGFRPDKLSEVQVKNLLTKEIGKKNAFIISFIEKFVKNQTTHSNKWSVETQLILAINDLHTAEQKVQAQEREIRRLENDLQGAMKNGVSEDEIEQYVLTIKEKETEIRERNVFIKGLEKEIKEKDEKLHRAMEQIATYEKRVETLDSQLLKRDEIVRGWQDKYKQDMGELSSTIKELELQLSDKEQDITRLTVQLENPNKIEEIDKRHLLVYRPQKFNDFMEDVKDAFGDLGIKDNKESFVSHIVRKIFSGKAIVSSRQDCDVLLNCISNVLTNGEVEKLIYSPTVNIGHIQSLLNGDARIIYLDNFIGNYNETMLIPLLEGYRDKIIFISAAYDKMFQYVADEFLAYVNYVNFSGYKVNATKKLRPTRYDEDVYVNQDIPNEKVCGVLNVILAELGFPQSVINEKIKDVITHLDANGVLMYEILPFMKHVRSLNPFANSETLNIYNEGNKIPASKQLMEKWYGK